YYGTNISVACYEKNPGDAGGNAIVTNTILSNAYESTILCDKRSELDVRFSASDNDRLPEGENNLFTDPAFIHPEEYNFSLLGYSRCISAGTDGNIGTVLPAPGADPNLVISEIAYLTEESVNLPEFIAILNPGSKRVDMSGWKITKGVTFEFPQGASVGPGKKIYVTADVENPFWNNRVGNVFQWESGRLADEGEGIKLETAYGIVVDGLIYDNKSPWPEFSDATKGIALVSEKVDNHFGENWFSLPIDQIVSVENYFIKEASINCYPNPARDWITLQGLGKEVTAIEIFNIQGERKLYFKVEGESCRINLPELSPGLYLIRAGKQSARLLIEK
ncbi:MAG: lamin tail domain-containing protein, partial [Prolixibacteraceae bacterium]|nr:lamin tail domain-containing protein [Prolixibacteraceae bacterium]